MKINWGLVCIVGVILFFGRIVLNIVDHEKYKERFRTACTSEGGITYKPKGLRGFHRSECSNLNAFISIKLKKEKL